jgi:hypothetical protein
MNGLTKSIEELIEGYYKENHEITEFLQGMVIRGELQAYNIKIDNEITEKDTEDEKIIRTIKGATLTPIAETQMVYWEDFFLKEPATETLYYVHRESHGSDSDFEPVEYLSGFYDITRLVKNSDLRKIRSRYINSNIPNIPEDMINGNLQYYWSDDIWELGEGTRHKMGGRLTVKGELDNLFEKVAEFIRNKPEQQHGIGSE